MKESETSTISITWLEIQTQNYLYQQKTKIQCDSRMNSEWDAHAVFSARVHVNFGYILSVCKSLISRLTLSKDKKIYPGNLYFLN